MRDRAERFFNRMDLIGWFRHGRDVSKPGDPASRYETVRRELIDLNDTLHSSQIFSPDQVSALTMRRSAGIIDLLELRETGDAPGIEFALYVRPGEQLHNFSRNDIQARFPDPNTQDPVSVKSRLSLLSVEPRITSSHQSLIARLSPFSVYRSDESDAEFAIRSFRELVDTKFAIRKHEKPEYVALQVDLLVKRILPLVTMSESGAKDIIHFTIGKSSENTETNDHLTITCDGNEDDWVKIPLQTLPFRVFMEFENSVVGGEQIFRGYILQRIKQLSDHIRRESFMRRDMRKLGKDFHEHNTTIALLRRELDRYMIEALRFRRNGDSSIKVALDSNVSTDGMPEKVRVVYTHPDSQLTYSVFSHVNDLMRSSNGQFFKLVGQPDEVVDLRDFPEPKQS